MTLAQVKDKLYRREADEASSLSEDGGFSHGGDTLPVGHASPASAGFFSRQRLKKKIKVGLVILAGISIIAAAFLGISKAKKNSFDEKQVLVFVSGPQETESGQAISYEIKYKNNNPVTLKNVSLEINYPDNFKPNQDSNFKANSDTGGNVSLGNIAGNTEGKFVLNGKAYSPRGSLIYTRVSLNYTPENFNSQFEAKNQLNVRVISTPISIEVYAPPEVSNGDAIDYQISYNNTGKQDFDNLRLEVDYPGGFTFFEGKPSVSEGNNVWNLGRLAAGQSGKIVISGKLEGSRDDVRTVKASLGVLDQGQFVSYNEDSIQTKIVAPPLSITQTVNGSENLITQAGDTLHFKINYRNDGILGLRNVIVTEKLEGSVLDYQTLQITGGAFDLNSKVITWKASDFANLKFLGPGQSGTITFSIKLKNELPVSGPGDKNFIVTALAKIDSPDVPTTIEKNKIIAGNEVKARLNTKIVFDSKGYYNDASIPNSGPIPPQVGQDTTYTIHWYVTNVSNDVSDARVETVLPTGVVMTGIFKPESADFTYDERSNSIEWEIGNISAGTGILSPPVEVIFQVKANPGINQVGKSVDLVGPATLTAKDQFTGKNLSITIPKKNTMLREDSGIKYNFQVKP